MKTKIAVFASGNGSNFETIVNKSKDLNFEVVLLFSDRKNALALERAAKLNIKTYYLSIIQEKEQFSKKILTFLEKNNIEFIVLAGYMKLINYEILKVWEGRIINIHPSLLPKFPGKDAIEQALNNNEKEFGITIHYVDKDMDTGKIIFQEKFLRKKMNNEEIINKIHMLEHKHYANTINKVLRMDHE